MKIRIRHVNGDVFVLPVTEVVVTDDYGVPLACSYEHLRSIVHCDATQKDWVKCVSDLGIEAKPVTLIKC